MSERPPSTDAPNAGPPDDVDNRYRRAAALDSSRPSDSVRRSVLEHAAKLASERSAVAGSNQERSTVAGPVEDIPANLGVERSAANKRWWRPAIFGALAAAGLAGLLIAPQYLPPRAPSTVAQSEVEATRRAADAAPSPPAAPPPLMARRQSMEKDRAAADNAAVIAESVRDKASSYAVPPELESLADARNAPAVTTGATTVAAPAEAPGATAATTTSAGAGATRLTDSLTAKPAGGVIQARSRESAAALRQAAETGDVQGLKVQVARSADIDARDAGGRTPLMLATLHGQLRAVEALLAAGADANAVDEGGVTPLQAAVNGNQPAIAAALRRAGAR
ncbi:MAG: ankyrin repeat domain-containing protein [Gammaproteobacteria bacterium]